MAFRGGNQTDGHKFKVRAGLPGVTWRALNEGVVPTRSSQKHVRETCAMLEAVSEVDKKYIDMEDDQALARLEEAESFIEAMGQEFAASVWYGDTGFEPKGIMGLSKRYGSLTGPANKYVIDCSGTGNNNASIWLVIHSTKDFFGVVPKNSKIGLQHKASGVIDLIDPDNGGTYEGYRDRFQWDVGVYLRDYRRSRRERMPCSVFFPDRYPGREKGRTMSVPLAEFRNVGMIFPRNGIFSFGQTTDRKSVV